MQAFLILVFMQMLGKLIPRFIELIFYNRDQDIVYLERFNALFIKKSKGTKDIFCRDRVFYRALLIVTTFT